MSRNQKVLLYRTLIQPVVMYRCETWILLKSKHNKLLIFKRKIIRKTLGSCRDKNVQNNGECEKTANLRTCARNQISREKLERDVSSHA